MNGLAKVRHTGRFLAVWLLSLPLSLTSQSGWLIVLIEPWPNMVARDMRNVFIDYVEYCRYCRCNYIMWTGGTISAPSFHDITDGCAVNSCQVQERVN